METELPRHDRCGHLNVHHEVTCSRCADSLHQLDGMMVAALALLQVAEDESRGSGKHRIFERVNRAKKAIQEAIDTKRRDHPIARISCDQNND